MRKYVFLLLILAACAKERSLVATVTANDGKNGHSLVTEYHSASTVECTNGGTRLDIFLDINDNLIIDDLDTYQQSSISCNGLNGLQGLTGATGEMGPQGLPGLAGINGAIGPQGERGEPGPIGLTGPQGPQGSQGPQGAPGTPGSSATILAYSASSCTPILGTMYYTKLTSSSNFALYSTPSCSNSSKFAQVSQGEAYWVSSQSLAVWSNNSLRVITFN